jgi:hypothetical protein
MAKEKCLCAENQKIIPNDRAVDFQKPGQGGWFIVARYDKTCPTHGYTVIEETTDTTIVVPTKEEE